MNPLERKILSYIEARSHAETIRPTTTEIYREFGHPAAKHALNMLQIYGHVHPISPRKSHGTKRFQITEAGRHALGRVAA